MQGRKQFLALIACLCGLLAVAGLAAAGKKLKTESQTVTVPPDAIALATPGCGAGTKAVSGGFSISSESPLLLITESLRAGNPAWTSEVHNNNSVEGGSLTGFAYCRDEKVESFTATTTLSQDETDTVSARCPAGMKAISGGFDSSSGEDRALVHLSRKVGKREWEVGARTFNTPVPLTAQVNCREGKKLKTKQTTETVTTFEGEDVVASCKRKQRVVSGGFAADQSVSKGGPFVSASRKDGKRDWLVTVKTFSNQITAYAYCEKKKKKNH